MKITLLLSLEFGSLPELEPSSVEHLGAYDSLVRDALDQYDGVDSDKTPLDDVAYRFCGSCLLGAFYFYFLESLYASQNCWAIQRMTYQASCGRLRVH